ncbi:hypothetical protein ACTQZF_05515 [Collinsella sp. LCP19S3_H3]|jgi:hypothetical protein|uniref:hypothetical protein n=1 Tax=Collinsella sp. LCP19S3_H3 TaxID=3438768 RepID=UPI003F924FB9
MRLLLFTAAPLKTALGGWDARTTIVRAAKQQNSAITILVLSVKPITSQELTNPSSPRQGFGQRVGKTLI